MKRRIAKTIGLIFFTLPIWGAVLYAWWLFRPDMVEFFMKMCIGAMILIVSYLGYKIYSYD